MLVMLGSLVGEPYSVAGEGVSLVNDLIPTSVDRDRLTGNGSERALGFHTENAYHRWLFRDRDLSPHSLMLLGLLSPATGAPRTLVANGRVAASSLTQEHRKILREPCVQLALPLRQRRGRENVKADASPILNGPEGAESVTAAFYGDMMQPVDRRAACAIKAFEHALQACAVGLTITPGTLACLPNLYTLHARDAFAPQFDQHGRAQRWLQRIFLTARLDAFQGGGDLAGRVFELPSASLEQINVLQRVKAPV
jgi:L-asparagine oxygenase